jgi:hypothetical protein
MMPSCLRDKPRYRHKSFLLSDTHKRRFKSSRRRRSIKHNIPACPGNSCCFFHPNLYRHQTIFRKEISFFSPNTAPPPLPSLLNLPLSRTYSVPRYLNSVPKKSMTPSGRLLHPSQTLAHPCFTALSGFFAKASIVERVFFPSSPSPLRLPSPYNGSYSPISDRACSLCLTPFVVVASSAAVRRA